MPFWLRNQANPKKKENQWQKKNNWLAQHPLDKEEYKLWLQLWLYFKNLVTAFQKPWQEQTNPPTNLTLNVEHVLSLNLLLHKTPKKLHLSLILE